MGDCVPDWEDMCGATEMGASLDSLDNLLKEKWENVELSSQITSFTPLSDHDIDQGSWGKGTSSPCPEGASVEQSDSPHKACPWQVEDSVAQLQPAHEVILSAKKTVDSVQGGGDDEMVSWLQYPLDSVLDKEYYQALAGCNLPCSKELFSERAVWDCQLKKSGAWSNDTGKVGGMDVTLSSESGGTGRSGGEVLSTLSIPQIAVKRKPYVRTPPNLTIPAWSPSRTSRSSSQDQSSGVVDPAVHVVSECATMLNFPHFSRPAALVKANLQSLGVACSATNQLRPRQNISSAGSALPGASFPSSSRFDGTAFSCPVKPKLYQESPFQLRGKGMESAALIQHCSGSTKNVCLPSCPNIEGSGAVCASCYLCASQVFDVSQQAVSAYDASESILGSSIGGSSISVVRGESALPVNMKRKVGEADSECLVGEPEDESLDTKRTFVIRSSATKRSRAAEVHNLSERRRRDRINEKMRALQDLIPNSNKTDKASMLDEAIEYLKMLQLHIQMISMKSGISIPSMILPPGSQQLRTRFSRPDADWDLTLGGVKSVGSGMGLGSIDATVPRQGVTSLFTPTQVLFGSSGDDQLQNSARVDSLLPHQVIQVLCHASCD